MDWKKPGTGGKYGLQLKIATPAAKKPLLNKSLPFSLEDNGTQDEYSVEDDIARQARKKQFAREVELQHKLALEQDANAFDYDGIYDEMKGKQAQPIREDRAKREPKYIGKLLEQAKLRAVEHDIAFERNLAKERAKEDHLFPDKEKFVTKAYKQKLIEQGKWLDEDRLKEIKEQAEEVTKKGDMGDFYRNLLSKNVAYGAKEPEAKKAVSLPEGNMQNEGGTSVQTAELATPAPTSVTDRVSTSEERERVRGREEQSLRSNDDGSESVVQGGGAQLMKPARPETGGVEEMARKDVATAPTVSAPHKTADSTVRKDEQVPSAPVVGRKSKEEQVLAAKERYLARKKQRNC